MGAGRRTSARAPRRARLALVLGVGGGCCAAIAAAVILVAVALAPAAARNPSSSEADRVFILGLGAYHQRDWPRAISSFESALSHDPDHREAREHLDLALAEDRNDQTLQRARRALEAGRLDEAAALATTIPATSVYSTEALEIRRQAGRR